MFMRPDRLTALNYWAGHIPFAAWIIDVAQPRLVVELGTETGVSYCAFCQAIAAYAPGAKAYAVDTWTGDGHTGQYGQDVLADLRAHHDPRYGAFSTLLPETFDSVRSRFADGSIDLLHIDGFHTYEAVAADFTTWLPKVSRRSVILMHDICIEDRGFGVWKFWRELSGRYRTFMFPHASGLGVLVPHDAPHVLVDWLVSSPNPSPDRDIMMELFQRLSTAWASKRS